MIKTDVIIIGASASGLMCAIEAGKRGRKVIVLDHANKAGKKILMSGGGKCNFTNYDVSAANYLSANPHFCKSALSRYTQWDFIALVEKYHIPYHEREHGQLFCNNSSKDILNLLLEECQQYSVAIKLNTEISGITKSEEKGFEIVTEQKNYSASSLVIATGGLSIPKMGATAFGYKVAEQFDLDVLPTRAGLVPFTLHTHDKEKFSPLSGIAIDALVSTKYKSFRENILFTHRGLSGPAILQVSSYWHAGEAITINLLPEHNLNQELIELKHSSKTKLKNHLYQLLPKRVINTLLEATLLEKKFQELTDEALISVAEQLHQWEIKPNGTEGYRTAEVTLGGVNCDQISSKTFEAIDIPGLYFIGEVLDVTGWLGGYNFQWAWSSGWCAGQYV